MAEGNIPYMFQVENVTNKVTFDVTVDTNYTFFYKIGSMVFYQIYFKESITANTVLATITDATIRPSRQFWNTITNKLNDAGSMIRMVIQNNGQFLTSANISETTSYATGYYILG